MKYLLHCIFESSRDNLLSTPSPDGERRLQVVERHGLCAAVSEITIVDELYDIQEIMNYHRAIEWFFRRTTVVPFRFGTLLEELADVERLLENRRTHYSAILNKLDGCAEIGLREIVDKSAQTQALPSSPPVTVCAEGSSPGTLYLKRRKAHFGAESMLAETNQRASAKYRAAFDGMFKEFRSEVSRLENRPGENSGLLLSIHFLVPKDLLERFRLQFAALASDGSSKLLLSGPWPPYNFVLSADSPTA